MLLKCFLGITKVFLGYVLLRCFSISKPKPPQPSGLVGFSIINHFHHTIISHNFYITHFYPRFTYVLPTFYQSFTHVLPTTRPRGNFFLPTFRHSRGFTHAAILFESGASACKMRVKLVFYPRGDSIREWCKSV